MSSPESSSSSSSIVSETDPEDRIGLVLANQLKLVEIIGHGYCGIVYKGENLATGAHFAVKMTKKGLQENEIALHRKASGHPNVVSLLEVVETEERNFLIMEYCAEGDLWQTVERGRYDGNEVAARAIFLQLLDAVQHCHSLGIYHCDLKPSNVLVTSDGLEVKLADFGLATTDRYSEDFGYGSLAFMPPGTSSEPTER
jgi:serine/threonine protein kinase